MSSKTFNKEVIFNEEFVKKRRDFLKTSFGPKGMSKAIVDREGNLYITRNGAAIIANMEFENSVDALIDEACKTQREEVGDGVKSVYLLTYNLLVNALDLLKKGVDISYIIQGYKLSEQLILNKIESLVYSCGGRESEFIRKIITNNYLSDPLLKSYSDDIIKLVNELMNIKNLKVDDVMVYKDKSNLFYEFPFLLKGIILDFGVRNPNVLDKRNSVNIAMFLTDLPEIPLDYQFKFIVDDVEAFNNFRKSLSEFLERQAKKLSSMEVRMLLCFGKVSTSLVENLSRHKILVVDTLGEFYIEKLRKICGCSPIHSIKSLTKTQLGKAKRVVVRDDEGGKHVLIEGFDDVVECFTILLRGAESKIDEIERLVDSIIRLIISFKKEPKVVYGGGCTEIKLARLLREMSTMYSNKVQKAIEAYAAALEELVGILIENSGRDPLTELARLNRYNSRENTYYGIDMESHDLVDVKNKELYEALSVKKAYIKNATKAALLSLKPDRIISEEVKF